VPTDESYILPGFFVVISSFQMCKLSVQSVRPAGPKITLPFPRLYICASALIRCAIITLRTLLPCDLTLVDLGNRWLLSARSSLPQLQLWDGYREAEAT